ncbi:MAG: hypothetical protein ACI9ND_002019, partial [Yoonia sp.]
SGSSMAANKAATSSFDALALANIGVILNAATRVSLVNIGVSSRVVIKEI